MRSKVMLATGLPITHGEFADYLLGKREEIIAEWAQAVHSESHIEASERLQEPTLIDHLPLLFEHLAELLCSDDEGPLTDPAKRNAQAHGIHRFQQGYRLDEVLRELTILRTVFLEHITAFEAEHPDFTGWVRTLALIRFHRFFDDMARRSAARFVEEQHATLRQANEAHALLLRMLAHEVRNVLNALGLAATALAEDEPSAGALLRQLISHGTKDLQALLEEFLVHSSLAAGQMRVSPQIFSPAVLARQIEATIGPAALQKGLRFETQVDPTLREVVGDELKTRQIIVNLLTNAIKYTSSGEVHLRVAAAEGDDWVIEVSDTGVGIAPEEQAQIFSEFYRVKSTARAPGLGLGLSIVARLVKLLKGTLQLQSQPGVGSRFEVILPRRLSVPSDATPACR